MRDTLIRHLRFPNHIITWIQTCEMLKMYFSNKEQSSFVQIQCSGKKLGGKLGDRPTEEYVNLCRKNSAAIRDLLHLST